MSYVVTVTANNRAAPSVSVTTGTGSATISVSTGSRGPIGNGTAIIQSETPPTNTAALWFDPSTGVYSIHNGNAWVVTSGLGSSSGTSAADVAPVAVADSTERKLAATYTALDVTLVNGLRVIQDDLPDVVWTLLDISDITDDANWYGGPRTNASGQLPLSGVKLVDGNVPFSFARYIPALSADWLTSSSANYMRLFTGITIPASLVVAGNKVAFSGTVRARKDSTGANTQLALTFQKAAMFDYLEANPATTEDTTMPIASIVDSAATLEYEGFFHAIYTLTAVTGTPTQLRLVANTDLSDGGKIWSFTGSAYAALGNPTADAVDTAGRQTNITAGEDWEIVIGIQGGSNAENKIHQIAVTGGINVWAP